jgi:hypothetical protein
MVDFAPPDHRPQPSTTSGMPALCCSFSVLMLPLQQHLQRVGAQHSREVGYSALDVFPTCSSLITVIIWDGYALRAAPGVSPDTPWATAAHALRPRKFDSQRVRLVLGRRRAWAPLHKPLGDAVSERGELRRREVRGFGRYGGRPIDRRAPASTEHRESDQDADALNFQDVV